MNIRKNSYSVIMDDVASRRYYIFDSITDIDTLQLQLTELAGDAFLPAQVGDDVTIQAKDGSLIILKDQLIDTIMPSESVYKIHFKIVEYHAYIDLENTLTNQHHFIGLAPREKYQYIGESIFSGTSYIRNDSYYDEKYFRGHIKYNFAEEHRDIDKASHSVSFNINKQQAAAVVELINHKIEYINHVNSYYNLLSFWNIFSYNTHSLFVDGNNCFDFVNSVYDGLNLRNNGTKAPNWATYFKSDELNYKDLGVFYQTVAYTSNWSLKSLAEAYAAFFKKHPYDGWFFNHNPVKMLECIKFHDKIDEITPQGYTAVHLAMRDNDLFTLKCLLEENPRLDIANNFGKIALSFAGYVDWSNDIELLRLIIKSTPDNVLNKFDRNNFSNPLIDAIKFKNTLLVQELLKDPRIELDVLNSNGDNIANIAAFYGDRAILKMIYDIRPDLTKVYNHETPTPICYFVDCVNDYNYQQYHIDANDMLHEVSFLATI